MKVEVCLGEKIFSWVSERDDRVIMFQYCRYSDEHAPDKVMPKNRIDTLKQCPKDVVTSEDAFHLFKFINHKLKY